MRPAFIERLAKLPLRELSPRGPADPNAIKQIEQQNKIRLPDDLRAALEFSDGFEIGERKTHLVLFDANDMTWTSSDSEFRAGLPDMLIVGTDGGGSLYYADPQDKIGRGRWAVYLVRMSDLSIPRSIFVAKNFTEAVETILAGTDILKRPSLQEESSSHAGHE